MVEKTASPIQASLYEISNSIDLLEMMANAARLSEQNIGMQRQIDLLNNQIMQSEEHSTRLTDAKFVTYRTLIDSQAERVKLALEATEKAIDKAEVATGKAIEKAETANNDRFAAVNEFRAQQTELIGRFATLERVDLQYNQARQRMDEINNNLIQRIAEQGDRLTELGTRVTSIESSSRGAQLNKSGIYAAIGAAIAIIGIIVVIANFWSKAG